MAEERTTIVVSIDEVIYRNCLFSIISPNYGKYANDDCREMLKIWKNKFDHFILGTFDSGNGVTMCNQMNQTTPNDYYEITQSIKKYFIDWNKWWWYVCGCCMLYPCIHRNRNISIKLSFLRVQFLYQIFSKSFLNFYLSHSECEKPAGVLPNAILTRKQNKPKFASPISVTCYQVPVPFMFEVRTARYKTSVPANVRIGMFSKLKKNEKKEKKTNSNIILSSFDGLKRHRQFVKIGGFRSFFNVQII